jgi:hypothetical protein
MRSTQYRHRENSKSPGKKTKSSLIHVTKVERKANDESKKMERFSSQGQEELV